MLGLPLKWQLPAICTIALIAFAPGAMLMANQSGKDRVKSEAQAAQQNQTTEDIEEALRRADRCILSDPKYPLVEGGRAFYKIDSKGTGDRLLPDATVLCSASGQTSIIQNGILTSIKSAPIEQLNKKLKQRGLIK